MDTAFQRGVEEAGKPGRKRDQAFRIGSQLEYSGGELCAFIRGFLSVTKVG